MEIGIIFTAAFVATSAMTVFSYAVSYLLKEMYKEPVLLQHVIRAVPMKFSNPVRKMLSWVIHYSIGFLFAWIYFEVCKALDCKHLLLTGAIAGSIFGIIGIAGWEMMFRYAGATVDKSGYYVHLFFAHIIFGIAMSWMFEF